MSQSDSQTPTYIEPVKRAEHVVKRMAFRLLRLFLKAGRPDLGELDVARMAHILLLRPETKLGDMLISLPVVDALRQRYPHLKISIWCSPRNVGLIEGDPRFERIHLYRKRFFADLAEMRRVRACRYDCVVDLLCDDSVTALVLSQYAAPGKPRLGMGKRQFARYYDLDSRSAYDPTRHIIINTLRAAAPLGVIPEEVPPYARPFLSHDDRRAADQFLSGLRSSDTSKLIGVNLSSGHPTREWGEEKTAELIEHLTRNHPELGLVVIATPSDRRRAIGAIEGLDRPVHLIPDRLNIRQVAAIIKGLDLLITPDTALVHIARAFKVPVVSLHTSHQRNFALWRPFGQEIGPVVGGRANDIHDITVAQVLSAFEQVVSSF